MASADNNQQLTAEQHAALAEHAASVVLSAGAGCGKTFVLTQRFISRLDASTGLSADASLRQQVAITFTERAAREMRGRIRTACRQRLSTASSEELAFWIDVDRQLETARISTIHSFCASLLRAHALDAALDPQFLVLDEQQSRALLREVIDQSLRELLAGRDENLLVLLEHFSLPQVRDGIKAFVRKLQPRDFDAWTGRLAADVCQAWQQFHNDHVVPWARQQVLADHSLPTLEKLIAQHPADHPKMQQRCAELTTAFAQLADCPDPQRLAEVLEHLRAHATLAHLGSRKGWQDEAVHERFKQVATEVREVAKTHVDRLRWSAEGIEDVAHLGLAMLRVARRAADEYGQRKESMGCLDFDDLILRARELLCDPQHAEVREQIAGGIQYLLVDEFQDTDQLQCDLVEALCGEEFLTGKLFVVGDYKQSIYRFRGAEPEVFRRLRERLPQRGRLPLSRNFRSQPAVLDFVNALFHDCFDGDYEPLVPHRGQKTNPPCVEFLWANDQASDCEDHQPKQHSAEALRALEADWIARRIRQMIDDGEPVIAVDDESAPGTRGPKLGDFVILFRALTDVELYEQALRRQGLDYYLVGGHAFYAQQEVYDVVNLLRAIESPADEVSLAGVLRSPFFSLADETLFWLARHPEGLAAGLLDLQEDWPLEAGQRQQAGYAAQVLSALRAKKDSVTVASLLREALNRTGYDALLLAEFLGERKLANLEKLIEQARANDANPRLSLADFTAQLADSVAQMPDEALAATHPEVTEVVRLMTIHQAKGLEFPVVIVADLERGKRSSSDVFAFDPLLGPLASDPYERGGTTGLGLYRTAQAAQDESESTRLFYVAATRAAEYLILAAGVNSVNEPKGLWRRLLGQRFDLETGRVLSELPAGYNVPQVKVTTTRPEAGPTQRARRRVNLVELLDTADAQPSDVDRATPREVRPIPADAAAIERFSFSQISGALGRAADDTAIENVDRVPATSPSSTDIDPLVLGELVHRVLAEWPALARVGDALAGDAAGLVHRYEKGQGDEQQPLIARAAELVATFIASQRAEAIRNARDVHCELEFLLPWPPTTSTTEAPAGSRSTQHLHGYIDCLYQDAAGAWHLLDFKTNRVSPENVTQAAEPYRLQLLLYAIAVQSALGFVPDEIAVVFLAAGREVSFTLDAAARQWMAAEIDRGIQALTGAAMLPTTS